MSGGSNVAMILSLPNSSIMVSVIDLKLKNCEVQNCQGYSELRVMIPPIEIKPSLKAIGNTIPELPDLLEKGQARTEFNILFENHFGDRIT
jgi:hypothetical protein